MSNTIRYTTAKHLSRARRYNIKNLTGLINVPLELYSAVEDAVEDVAKFLRYEAWKRCPVDTGHLQKHIYAYGKIYPKTDDMIKAEVFEKAWGHEIKLSIRATGERNKKSHPNSPRRAVDYAYYVHEYVAPFGAGSPHQKGLGPLSKAKQAQFPDVVVGGGFITRAFEDNKNNVLDMINSRIKKALK